MPFMSLISRDFLIHGLNAMKPKHKLRQEAIELRQQGYSIRQIADELNVSKGSVSAWVRDIVLSDEQKAALDKRHRYILGRLDGANANRKKALEMRQHQQNLGRERTQDASVLHLTGCMLYWAEGAKRRDRIHFVNSDVHMMSLFMRFLREELHVEDSEISLFIHCHQDYEHDTPRLITYWLNALNLTQDNMRSIYIKKGSHSRKNILENGIATVCVYRTDLVMHIFGAIQVYGGFDNPDWLF